MTTRLPDTASVAQPADGVKLHAPAAARNAEALTRLLSSHAPRSGHALEIASGTGQHVTAFAQALPDLIWQPTDVDPARIASIDAYVRDAALQNVAPARMLDATQAGWRDSLSGKDLIILVNLLHLIGSEPAKTLIAEAVGALVPRGRVILYGPFKRSGDLTSPGDMRFDADLRAADPEIGYKNDEEVVDWLASAGAKLIERIEMPANNLALIASRA
ncbi:DUF938 domain-containing protein [Roseobacter sp. YSTF-M11]|uniref:DUF938 domain-containing protein n=1 Tax=Roseobacter insulae TaxID=2859783 RepID=A0A9X1FYK2_9RHOB|nr:DUF938 domain-containing protein [Roseobacter insulae]MBW4710540.1 DUF938 domain-containing protein [Roseobacter insulae]